MKNLKPVKGDVKQFYGKRFVYSGTCWVLDEVLTNVITKKNVGPGKYYNGDPDKHVTGAISFHSNRK